MESTMRRLMIPIVCALALASASCRQAPPVQQTPPEVAAAALPPIDGPSVLEHIKVLASDEYEGRAPGTKGEELTVAYITDQLKKLGIRPGNTDGTYVQNVPLVGITVQQSPALTFRKGGLRQSLKWRDDYVAWTKRVVENVSLDRSDLVFVGYGVQAPEFDWDDYKGTDLKGKTMVVLVGDPPVKDPANPDALDPNVFEGKAMTYYGRWTYKYEMGAKLGAAGVLIVHETGPAGYPFTVVQGKTAEQFDLVAPDKNMGRAAIEGWITLDQGKKLVAMAGLDYDALKKQAVTREFKPVPLGVTASVTLQNTIRTVDSRNVVGRLEGSDPKLKDEYVIYTAHWDHFGIGVPVNGDRIYHGAQDNASGVGGVIEIARAFTKLSVPPRRSILFLFVTAEEQGLLGSGYYAMSPIYPLAKTAAVINIDGMNLHGKTKDLEIVGLGLSDLDGYMQKAAAGQGRIVKPNQEPEKGGYFRSDHFPFAKEGTPAINAGGGIDYVGRPADYGRKIRDAYTANDYHKPSDTIKPDWDLSGAVQDLELYLTVGYQVAQAEKMPEWKTGAPWKAKRDQQLKGEARK
jgi:Zn-dependent M28 family amino/carboxypeptidase